MYNTTKKVNSMNNNNIKNLRQAMLSTAAAVLVSIGFIACSDETFMTQKSTAPADGYQVCIPANIGGGSTRAIAYNSESGGYDATFETTDEISAFHISRRALDERCLRPDKNGKSANLVGRLYFGEPAPSVGDELLLCYKNDGPWFYYSHDFTKDNSEVEYAVAKVKVEAVNGDQMTLSTASFYNPQSIVKINFTGISSDVKIKKMTISSENRKLVNSYEPANPDREDFFGNVTYTYQNEGTSQRELTYMLRFGIDNEYNNNPVAPGDVLTFTALGSDGHSYRGTKSVSNDLENSKYYHADVAMADGGLALTLTNNTTGEPVEINEWTVIESKAAPYTLKNTGYNVSFGWRGGNNKLTLNGVTINNSNNTFLHAETNSDDPDNTKDHYLVLDGENTTNSPQNGAPALSVSENCTLTISAASGGGKLAMNGQGTNIHISDNAKIVLESGELIINGWIGFNNTSSFVITNNGKLRCKNSESIVKAGSGYKLVSSIDGDYTVYTVTAADPYESPKALSSATTADIGKIIGNDGNIHVPNWDLPAGVSPVAMITSISSTGHGLAVAVDRVKVRIRHFENNHEWYSDAENFSWDDTGYENDGKTATEIFDDWKANNNVTFGTWRFATTAEWQQMALDCGINGDANEAGDEMVAEGLVGKLKEVGIFGNHLTLWTGETGAEEGLLTAISFYNLYWEGETEYQGPYKLNVSKWNSSGVNCNILPALEF